MSKVIQIIKDTAKAEGRAEGELLMLVELVEKGLISLEVAAESAGITEEDFSKKVASIDEIKEDIAKNFITCGNMTDKRICEILKIPEEKIAELRKNVNIKNHIE